jgi:hypothetical protein
MEVDLVLITESTGMKAATGYQVVPSRLPHHDRSLMVRV